MKAVVAGAGALVGVWALTLVLLLAGGAYALVPVCQTEDSTGCLWQADKQGNGVGQSFYAPAQGKGR
jgi:hypothetical protein